MVRAHVDLVAHTWEPLILSLRRPDRELAVGQVSINSPLQDHLVELYALPTHTETHEVGGYLGKIAIHRLTETQAKELDREIKLEALET
ncbi:hypothetical protein NDU88_011555 [Pleurodeles waltl]|uniref:Uncharacterized protein n=1 Tax=Pleurodeles waltl TaxID=8319 RepID=A0AAV7S448_PLEWA|nr:hypothetical protein NDU88_011555 [Pleurodeles waltl]